MTCEKCEEEGQKVYYVGESGRTAFDRGAEHAQALRKVSPESPLVEHNLEVHPDSHSRFRMEIIAVTKTNLLRQAMESVKIQVYSEKYHVLNRRGEWNQNLPPKLTLDGQEDTTLRLPAKRKDKDEDRNPPQGQQGQPQGQNDTQTSQTSQPVQQGQGQDVNSAHKKTKIQPNQTQNKKPKKNKQTQSTKSTKAITKNNTNTHKYNKTNADT